MIVQIIQIPPLDLLKRDVGLLMAADDDAGLVEGQIASDAEVQVHHAVQFGLVADVAENVLVFGRTEQLVAVRIEDDLVDRIVEAVRQLVQFAVDRIASIRTARTAGVVAATGGARVARVRRHPADQLELFQLPKADRSVHAGAGHDEHHRVKLDVRYGTGVRLQVGDLFACGQVPNLRQKLEEKRESVRINWVAFEMEICCEML